MFNDITETNNASIERDVLLSREANAKSCAQLATNPVRHALNDEWRDVDAGLRAMFRALAVMPLSREIATFIHNYRVCKANGDGREAAVILVDFAKWLRKAQCASTSRRFTMT